MRNLLLSLTIAVFGTAQFINAQSTYISWTDHTYEIRYTKDGESKTLKGRHKIPKYSNVLENGTKLATKGSDVITRENLNYWLLDSLMWRECNRYRRTKNLPAVAYDNEIRKAASNHAYYMAHTKNLVHNEEEELVGRKTEQDHYQAVFRGAAEICLYNHAYLEQSTYQQVAENCIEQWRNSPGHNAIMIDKNYEYNGFGVRFSQRGKGPDRELLARYNPQLLRTIDRECPYIFQTWEDLNKDEFHMVCWASANFRWARPNIPEHLQLTDDRPGRTNFGVATTERRTNSTPSTTAAAAQEPPAAVPSAPVKTTNNHHTNAGNNGFRASKHTAKRRDKGDFWRGIQDYWRRKRKARKQRKRARKSRRGYWTS